MKRFLYPFLMLILIAGFPSLVIHAQLQNLHGDDSETRMGDHSGNQFRTTFYNDGTYGAIYPWTSEEVRGEWPINSGHIYLVDGNIFVGSEVPDRNTGQLFHILSENKSYNYQNSTGDKDPVTGAWWTFLPLPGFADPNGIRVAMAKGNDEWPNSWPAYWPDKFNDVNDPGWRNDNVDGNPEKAAWNGYFGKSVFNADEESYFVADDYMNREFMSQFLPDDNDPNRGGLGLRLSVRGFQWAKASVEDALFVLCDIQNIGTYNHDKMIFAYKIGNNNGDTNDGSDSGDDGAEFVREENGVTYNLAYTTDNEENLGYGGWGPVGLFGGAFLESPGNPYDGIDNDNDGHDVNPNVPGSGTGDEITEAMFNRGTLNLDSPPIILINYSDPTFPRSEPTTLRQALTDAGKSTDDTLLVFYGIRSNRFWAGKELVELGDNLVDDNLNGVIDESRGQPDESGNIQYLYVGYRSINYFTGNGLSNYLLDERRDDGIDNDGDWTTSPEDIGDDVGADGLAPGVRDYPGLDFGESDGIPTSGEPHFDKTDIDETDQLGLTGVNLYQWDGANNQQYNDEGYWNLMVPGIFTVAQQGGNYELLFGSGYFPMAAGQTERISMGLICGLTRPELLSNTQNVALAYNNNYNFAKAPNVPTVRAVPGDNRVTLFWDDFAEQSEDPITGRDFEGYRIYRSTDPGFNDGGYITEARFGTKLWSIPIAQFDLANDIYGIQWSVPTLGVQFDLGSDTGLRHYWVDTTAVNGTTYFYAVTSYDHGSIPVDPVTGMRVVTNPIDPRYPVDTLQIDPSECAKFVAIQGTGDIEKGKNVVVVRPEALTAGYIQAELSESGITSGANNTAQGTVNFRIIDATQIKDNHTYEITFSDSSSGSGATLTRSTESFTLVDITGGNTVLLNNPMTGGVDGLPVVDGFQLEFADNPETLGLDSANSGWSRTGIPSYNFTAYFSTSNPPVELIADDFEISFADVGVGVSEPFWRGTTLVPGIPVNFTIVNTRTNQAVPFAFREVDTVRGGAGVLSWGGASGRSTDEIIFLTAHPEIPDSMIPSWWVRYNIPSGTNPDTIVPGPGDVLTLSLNKPFLPNDRFEFTVLDDRTDNELAKADMERIKVVPNPYIVTNSWEPSNPYSDGRGERELHFTHLPPRCTIRIFNVRGQLVNTLEHEGGPGGQEQVPEFNGTYTWNMLSRDNLEISYGIYIYHIDAPGIGEKIGKFVVIK
jgi:hypothetical protein